MQTTDFFDEVGLFHVDVHARESLKQSILFRASFHNFYTVKSARGYPRGWDRAREQELGDKFPTLTSIQEVFSSSNWIVRIYEVG